MRQGLIKFLLAALVLPAFCFGQISGEKYLSFNKCAITPGDSLKTIAFLDTVLYKYRFFLAGETHGVASNTALSFMWLKHLYKNANVRNYVIEYPQSKS